MQAMRRTLKSLCVTTTLVLAFSAGANAQGLAAGSFEASGNVGFSNLKGVDNDHHASFGGEVAFNLAKTTAIGFEYNYLGLGSVSVSGATASGHLQTYGPVARFSFAATSRVAPYVLLAAGGANLTAVASEGNIKVSASQGGYYFGFGGGAAIYLGDNWGIRPEYRYERQQFNATTVSGQNIASSGQNYSEGSIALFYQFGGTRSMKK
jgi:opacity protein-like surface antigen